MSLSLFYLFEVQNHNTKRSNIKLGSKVSIVKKSDQRTGRLVKGKVKRILTNKRIHTRGIKVMLQDGTVGRVQKIH